MKSKTTKIIIIPLIALIILIVTAIFGVSALTAKERVFYPPIVKKLAEKFNLDINEVRKVFDNEHETIYKKHHEQLETRLRLDKAVEEGQITEAQEQAILEKMAEMKTKIENLKNLSVRKRRKIIRNLKEKMQKWARNNGINLPFLKKSPSRCEHNSF